MTLFEIFGDAKNNPLFRGADDKKVSEYLCGSAVSVAEYETGDVICSPESSSVKTGIIISGRAAISPCATNRGVLLRRIGKGCVFGIANLYAANGGFPSRITAVSRTSVVFIEPESYKKLLENDAVMMNNFLEFISGRVVYLNRKIASYTAGSVEQRLAFSLLENEEDGKVAPDITISDMANTLDVGRASLYRAFDSLTEKGLIVREEKWIIIKDKETLSSVFQ